MRLAASTVVRLERALHGRRPSRFRRCFPEPRIMPSREEECQERTVRAPSENDPSRGTIGVLLRPKSCAMVRPDINSNLCSRMVARGSAWQSFFLGASAPGVVVYLDVLRVSQERHAAQPVLTATPPPPYLGDPTLVDIRSTPTPADPFSSHSFQRVLRHHDFSTLVEKLLTGRSVAFGKAVGRKDRRPTGETRSNLAGNGDL